jgi:hypothetical protein
MITLLHNQRPNIPFNMHLELIPFIDSAVVKSELQDLVCDFQKKTVILVLNPNFVIVISIALSSLQRK